MKIRLDVEDKHFEYETTPMSPERFKVVCKLVGVAICGVVLLVAIRLVGAWAIGGAVAAQVLYGLYGLAVNDW